MKLKAPAGVGDPCIAGVTIRPRDGLYEVEAEIAALLIECFGFAAIEDDGRLQARATGEAEPRTRTPRRRSRPAVKKS